MSGAWTARGVELTRLGLGGAQLGNLYRVVYLHDAEHHWGQALEEAVPALLELRDEGVVRAVGAGMNVAANLAELVLGYDVDLMMCAGRYTLLEQADDLMDAAQRRGTTTGRPRSPWCGARRPWPTPASGTG